MAIRPALSFRGESNGKAAGSQIGLVASCLVYGRIERKACLVVDRRKMAIRNADCIAGVDLALSGTVHVNDLAVAVSEIDTRGERYSVWPLTRSSEWW